MKRVILVFLKLPETGRVKTRLAADLGEEGALRAYRQMVARVLEQCRDANPDVIALAFDPAEKRAAVESWLSPYLRAFTGQIQWIPQPEGNLGERLEAAVEQVFASSADCQLAVIGTDCVTLDRSLFEETHTALESGSDVVYGPAGDGGYYLVAMKRPHPALFREIPWSASGTLEASLRVATREKLSVHQLPVRLDVDTIVEWETVKSDLSGRRCVFFDRDGVVNRSPGSGYVLTRGDFHLNPGIGEAIRLIKEKGSLAILVTSQKGVGKGLMPQTELDEIHREMQIKLRDAGAAFDGIYAYTGTADCPHRPKPDPEMILSAAESFFIDLRRSWIVGDADRDIEMGIAAGLGGTIRIRGEKPIGIEADDTLDGVAGIADKFDKLL